VKLDIKYKAQSTSYFPHVFRSSQTHGEHFPRYIISRMQRYDGHGTPAEHLEKSRTLWRMTPPEEWPHYFIHTLEGITTNWYVD
jgi:hypothetical protein